MLYIVKAFEGNEIFEYEYGNIQHAKEHYNQEKSAELWKYEYGKEILIEKK